VHAKTRRVKCDETKPKCLRCERFGRDCDGYPDGAYARGAIQPIQPRIPIVLYGPSTSIHGSQDESQYFQAFIQYSAHELPGYFDAEFWARTVLQESHAVTPIRHAVIALGALNRSLENAPGPQLKVNIIQTVDRIHHEYAVLHYIKSIQTLNQYLSTSNSPQLRIALICCVLFVCFETFQGSFASSVQQAYGGLKILRSYHAGRSGSKPRSRPKSSFTSKALQIRAGCDGISKERVIAQHVEEYLDHQNISSPDGDEVTLSAGQTLHPTEAFSHNSGVDQIAVEVSGLSGQDYSIYPHDGRNNQSVTNEPESQDTGARQSQPIQETSSAFSNSAVSTPPESNGPRTPSSVSTPQGTSSSRKRPIESRSPTSLPLRNDQSIEESLIQTFVRLDGHGMFFGLPPGIPPLIWDIYSQHQYPIPTIFSDIASAQRCWDFLMDRALQFLRRTLFNRAYSPSSCESPSSISNQYSCYLEELTRFGKALQPIFNKAIEPDGTVSNPAALLIAVYQRCTLISLAAVRSTSEMVYDIYLPHFEFITQTCARLIQSQSQRGGGTRFTFDVGVVPPLHVTATKCRDPYIRRRAIELLFACRSQEGMWDSVLSARIGKWVTSCEEDGLSLPALGSQQLSSSFPTNDLDPIVRKGFGAPIAAHISKNVQALEGLDNMDNLSALANETAEHDQIQLLSGENPDINAIKPGQRRNPNGLSGTTTPVSVKGWKIPESNRVKLMVVDFHIADRYIKVKCQKSLLRKDGTREERETVIAW
jgi:hypothetical protein